MRGGPNTVPPRSLALVTGASSGIGAEFARALAARGYDLVLVARRKDRLDALATELSATYGVAARSVPTDLSKLGAHQAVFDALGGARVGVLVNNAGFSIPQSFAAVPWQEQQDFLMTLVVNACGLAYGVIGPMQQAHDGRIINVASLAGFSPGVAGHTLYPGAKSLMIKFTQALDAEYRADGLKITALCPGFVRTEFAAANGTSDALKAVPSFMFRSARHVVDVALAANDKGRVIAMSDWQTSLAAKALQHLPQAFVRRMLMRGSARYHLDNDAPAAKGENTK